MEIDVAVLGRVGIDLYPNQLRTPLREVRTYTRFVGGFAGNVATGLARLGSTPAIVSRVGPDPHGEFVRDFLSGEGVDVRFLAVDERLMTPPTFCEVWPPDRFPITFYRYPTAPDWQLSPEDFDAAEVAAAPFLLATGTGLAQSPSRETTLGALAAHEGVTIFDLDWRPTLWERADDYSELARAAARHADVVIGNEEEVEAAAGEPGALLELGVPTLVLKRGERGALLFHDGEEMDVPGHPVDVVNGLGAGDAFVAAFVQSLHAGLAYDEAVRRGSVAGALVASQLACSEAMPTLEELEAELA
ncbi:MAG TPA: 5-dehydro-2-deoxygluconokinase [Gaiellaceae bacterium]|nr:5-dehydro-2-deoxygluconokinase [Gaiellaceae bacterium]